MGPRMVCVYRATSGVQAHLARLILARFGLFAEVRNEHSVAVMAPLNEIMAEVWVRQDDVEAAHGVLAELDRPPEGRGGLSLAVPTTEGSLSLVTDEPGALSPLEQDGPDRPCPACGAPNPPGFEVCWQCEAHLDEV
ncbi:MAG: DUF2007 domain-containing protein [Deltaproteobacteria bacterium]|nr:DUF2007 domain-containing protein [Deltaproteobacteria bacterium]